MRWTLSLLIVFTGLAVPAFSGTPIDLSDARVVVSDPGKTIMVKAAEMLRDEVEKRTRISLEIVSELPPGEQTAILIGTGKELAGGPCRPLGGREIPASRDGYAVWTAAVKSRAGSTVCATGHDDRGTLFAVGRLLRALDMERDVLELDSGFRVVTAPRHPLRGHQLGYRPKTNSYDGWDLRMWEQYYRDLIVFGTNAVELIPPASDDHEDSPHFPKPKLEMMAAMSQLAADYGLDVWIWFTALDEIDDVKVDYGDPKTIDASLEEWAEVFRRLPRIDDVFVPGGDPGNTHPAILLPFMEKQKRVLNEFHPEARIWVSPQNFDRIGRNRDGWYEVFIDILRNDEPKWLDGVVFGPTVPVSLFDLRIDVPARYPIRRYPDITHAHSCPYAVQDWDEAFRRTEGREVINPRPLAHAQIFRAAQDQAIGFVSYSEGCNDDFNKILWSALGWDPDAKIENIVAEYSRYFIGKRHQESFARGLFGLERNWVGPLKDNDGVDRTLGLFQEMERESTPQDKLNWRFQQALYRAYYDAYVRHRLLHELALQTEARGVLGEGERLGSLAAMEQAEAILDRADTERVATDLRLRVFELAEALFQSIRMQHSVEKHHSQRYHNLDDIDVPLSDSKALKEAFAEIRGLDSEEQRLARIAELASAPVPGSAPSPTAAEFPDWTVEFDRYQTKRSRLWKAGGPGLERERQ